MLRNLCFALPLLALACSNAPGGLDAAASAPLATFSDFMAKIEASPGAKANAIAVLHKPLATLFHLGLAGNTSESDSNQAFIDKLEQQYPTTKDLLRAFKVGADSLSKAEYELAMNIKGGASSSLADQDPWAGIAITTKVLAYAFHPAANTLALAGGGPPPTTSRRVPTESRRVKWAPDVKPHDGGRPKCEFRTKRTEGNLSPEQQQALNEQARRLNEACIAMQAAYDSFNAPDTPF